MNHLKSHFWYINSQRNGIFFLILFIVLFQLVFFFVDFSPEYTSDLNSNEGQKFQQKIDSLKQVSLAIKRPTIYPFNPSFLTDYKGYKLGMTTEEIDRLLKHRAKGKYINSANQFQQVTKVSDSLLKTVTPYFKFPDWIVKKNLKAKHATKLNTSKISQKENTNSPLEIRDLNTATAYELKQIRGIGDKLSQRIIKYRKKLGGFLVDEQLYEVWYLDKEIADNILKRFAIINKPIINKINVNTATFKEVLSIVYIDYQLTKKIFDYRDEVAELQSIEELKKIDGFPIEKFDRIALYLEAK